MESKKCTKCDELKEISEYNRDGIYRRSECKVCSREASRIYRLSESRQKARDRKSRYDKKNLHPAKKKARAAVYSCIKSGKIAPIKMQKCDGCGNGADHYHHHAGYDKKNWLNVVPLCVKCHNLAHRDGER